MSISLQNSGYTDARIELGLDQIENCGSAEDHPWLASPDPLTVPAGAESIALSLDVAGASKCKPGRYRATLLLREVDGKARNHRLTVDVDVRAAVE